MDGERAALGVGARFNQHNDGLAVVPGASLNERSFVNPSLPLCGYPRGNLNRRLAGCRST
jgi:hypothetical protein